MMTISAQIAVRTLTPFQPNRLCKRVFEKYCATLQVLAWFRETGECQTITMPLT